MFKFNSFVCDYPCLHISTAEVLSLAQIFTAKEAQRSTSLSRERSRFTSGCRPPARCNCAVNMFTGYTFILKMYIYLFCFVRLWCNKTEITFAKQKNIKSDDLILLKKTQTFILASASQARTATHCVVLISTWGSLVFRGSTRACMPPCSKMLDLMISCPAMLQSVAAELAAVPGRLPYSCWTRTSWPPASYTALENTTLVNRRPTDRLLF